ncbi:cell cycle progression protein 1 isoform X2 [Anolis sagrei]|uniref:cell cycle progression protein 1 isoform X2 n=1 Tax=Anolis sagrei TaxID=38937 RepID=UPI0035209211
MAENSSDSDSSCGWTVINHEGSDIEALVSEGEGLCVSAEPEPEELPPLLQESDQQEQPALDLQAEFGQGDVSTVADQSPLETTKDAQEEGAKGPLPEDGACLGALSDDSDIVTLEAPKAEEGLGSQSEAPEAPADDGPTATDMGSDMGSSFSSQYTFCQPEAAFPPPPPPPQESSSDEGGPRSSPALRRRRAKKRPLSTSESEDTAAPLPPPLCEPEVEPQPPSRRTPFVGGSGLNRCILLALLVAVSMGFGHFYGTIQIQSRQQLVEKTHLDELKDVKEDLIHCQQEQGSQAGCQGRATASLPPPPPPPPALPLQEGLAACLRATEAEKAAFESQKLLLSSENLRLRESLEKEEAALASLQEELRKLRERIRLLEEEEEEEEGKRPEAAPSETQRLKAHLEEEQRRAQGFVRQKAALLAEAQMLRQELDKERRAALALREEVERMSAAETPQKEQDAETERLKGRLAELEKRLRFEEQRSDLWEKLYVEAKGQAQQQPQPPLEPKDRRNAKKKSPSPPPKSSFFGSVKETFDAMKNSTKAFVRHHKEKIKRAKEAVKENLRRFSDSVKSTFRQFKDSTRTDAGAASEGKRRHGEKRREARKGRHHEPPQQQQQRAPGGHGGKKCPGSPSGERKGPLPPPKGCLGIFDCARQEFAGLFDRVLGPIRADEFHQLMHKFLQQEVGGFRHWRELEAFLGRFFRNGVFIHDQMLFADFVNDVKDYLQDMEEYRGGAGAFGDLDTYIYQYYFHYEPAPEHHGDSHPAKKAQQERNSPKAHHPHHHHPHHPQRQKREGSRWQKEGRHTANLEIEVGQMPFHPKY